MRAVKVVGWLWFAAIAITLLLRWIDVGGPVPMVQSLLPLAGLSAVLLVALACILRIWPLAGAGAALLVPLAVLAAPWWFGGSGDLSDRDAVVMTVNLEYGQADMAQVEAAVDGLGVDVLVLTETTSATQEALDQGALATLPHRSGTVREDAGGTLILTADPHTEIELRFAAAFDHVAVEIDSGGFTWRVLGSHIYPPEMWDAQQWRADLRSVERWLDAQAPEVPLVVAGDLNASQGHPGFRSAFEGFDSAHQRVGAGWVRTWPTASWIPRFIQLDHILVRGLSPVDAGTAQIDNTDHLAAWGRLRLPVLSGD